MNKFETESIIGGEGTECKTMRGLSGLTIAKVLLQYPDYLIKTHHWSQLPEMLGLTKEEVYDQNKSGFFIKVEEVEKVVHIAATNIAREEFESFGDDYDGYNALFDIEDD